jgi:allantoinase
VSGCVIRGGTLVLPEGPRNLDLAVDDGIISEIGPDLAAAAEEVDARGLHIFPGVMDIHVHFNEPGRTEWEGTATGSRALAAGGGTTFFDMPLNSTPCTVNAREFDGKRVALEAASIADFGLWGGLTPGSVDEMEELAARGVIGFKAFMCDSGLPEFPRSDDATLYEGLKKAARLDLPIAVHAENQELTAVLTRRMIEQGRAGIRDFLESRPVIAEVEAIQRATLLAGEAGTKLHIVHVSSGRGVVAALEARSRGVDVSIETCPHYLFFRDEDVERLGAILKCAPPLRDSAQQDALWAKVLDGSVDAIASDHSPAPPAMKTGDFWKAWGGIQGVQSTLSVLLACGFQQRKLPLERVAALVSANPARRFQIPNKGRLAYGCDADIALVDLSASHMLRLEDLHQRHPLNPYVGAKFVGVVRRTIRRGETIFQDGTIRARDGGRLVRPCSAKNNHARIGTDPQHIPPRSPGAG